ncbi:MAG: chemotaxis protein CheC [Nitrospira bacterium SG8_35_4]|nr:MAG: chemotaxis protein CheC [Nitrospira bacterium SG8_35_4]
MDTEAQSTQDFSDEEVEILQEIMNIAFGQSASDLAEVIDTQVVLAVPFIKIMQVPELPVYIKENVKKYKQISIVEQKFWGKLKGDALLIFSSGSGKALIKMLQSDDRQGMDTGPVDILERETLMEVGNILIGACVGKLAELLHDIVTYTPPLVLVEKEYEEAITSGHYDPEKTAIVLKTDFLFERGNVSGFLFLVTSNESIKWLRDALKIFIEQYE